MSNKRILKIFFTAMITIGMALLVTISALAVHDLEFELDGNIAEISKVDWAGIFHSDTTPFNPLPTNFKSADFAVDFIMNASGPDRTTFTTGSKDILNITPGWQCARSNNVNDKIDLINVYATAYVNSNGH